MRLCEAIFMESPRLTDERSRLDPQVAAPTLHDFTPMHIVCSAGCSYPAKTHEEILTTLLCFGHSVTKADAGYRKSDCLQTAACSMQTPPSYIS